MTRLEMNELMVGVGIVGIAAYLLWPHRAPAIVDSSPQGQAQALEQLGGITVPTLPGYLSSNRPAYAIQPAPFTLFGNPSPGLTGWGVAPAAGLPKAPPSSDLPASCCC